MGHMHLVPIWLDEGLTVSHMQAWTRRGGDFFMLGASGVDGDGKPSVIVAYEQPVSFSLPRNMKGAELLHVERFRVDARARGGGDPFAHVALNPDGPSAHPDFFVSTPTEDNIGLECTQFALENRRTAHGLVGGIKRRIMRSATSKPFTQLRGMTVYVSFGGPESMTLPYRTTEVDDIDELVALIAAHTPEPEKLAHDPALPAPEEAPDIGIVRAPSGTSVHAAPLPGEHQPSPFMVVTGFELGLAYTTKHTPESAWDALSATIERKDKDGNDWLLVTAGGPDRGGFIYPAEEAVAQLLIDHPRHTVCRHLGKVVLHRWATGDAWSISPEVERLCSPPADPPPQVDYGTLSPPPGLVVARNDDCPCGSGKKFKRCHG